MSKTISLFLLVFIISANFVLAEDTPTVFLTLVDAVSKEIIGNVYVQLKVDNKITNYYLQKDENLKLNLKKGEYDITFLINDPKTSGNDYYGRTIISVEEKVIKTIFLYPVGSLGGFVKDKLDNVISYADLKFECNNVFKVDYPKQTDNFGSFSLEYIPIGKCKILGNFNQALGSKELEIKKGSKNNVDINLNQIIISGKNQLIYIYYLIFSVLFLIFFLVLFKSRKKIKYLLKKEKKEEKEIKELKKELELGQRGKDIYQTLRGNEKKIVEFLLNQKEPIYLSKIHYKTGISKGSLFRNLESLEKKNIVETIREGKVRKTKLSAWFLGK
tara:strand:+ start:130 stop:1119 length:990 start_codon:yes stop_codon:yes gene_type:complete